MNWKKIAQNMIGSAMTAGAAAAAHGVYTGNTNWVSIAIAAGAGVVTNLAGLFQQPPSGPAPAQPRTQT